MTAIVTSFQITDDHDFHLQTIADEEHGDLMAWEPICNYRVVSNLAETVLSVGTDQFSIDWQRIIDNDYPLEVLSVMVRALLLEIDWIDDVDLTGFDAREVVNGRNRLRNIGTICYSVGCDVKDAYCYESINLS